MTCTVCGEFIQATTEDGTWVPIDDECPDCGGREFKHNGLDTVVRTDEDSDRTPAWGDW